MVPYLSLPNGDPSKAAPILSFGVISLAYTSLNSSPFTMSARHPPSLTLFCLPY